MTPTKVLVAEDYDDARDVMALVLESAGFQVIEARDGVEALDAARTAEARGHRHGHVHAEHGRDWPPPAPCAMSPHCDAFR
jgi:CheY-like chemotaxis protein